MQRCYRKFSASRVHPPQIVSAGRAVDASVWSSFDGGGVRASFSYEEESYDPTAAATTDLIRRRSSGGDGTESVWPPCKDEMPRTESKRDSRATTIEDPTSPGGFSTISTTASINQRAGPTYCLPTYCFIRAVHAHHCPS